MTNDEIIRLVLDVQGTDKVKSLESELGRLQKEFATSVGSMKGMDAATIATDANIQRIASHIRGVTADLAAARGQAAATGTALNQTVTTADRFGRASGGVKGLTQSFVGLSRAAQDFSQGGFGAIINNVEQVAFAAGPAAAATATVFATAAYVAYQNWDHVRGLFEERWPTPDIDITPLEVVGKKLDDLKKRKDDLGRKTTLNAGEVQQLQALQAEEKQLQDEQKYQQRIKGLKDAHSRVQSETAAAVDEALVQSGQEGTLETLIDRLTKGAEANGSPALKKTVASLKERLTKGDESAYKDLIDLSGEMTGKGLGKGSTLHKQLIENAPWKKREEQFLDDMAAMLETSVNATGESVDAEKMGRIKSLLADGEKGQAKAAMKALADGIHGTDNAFSDMLSGVDAGMLKSKPGMDGLKKQLADRLMTLNRDISETKALNEQGQGGLAEAMEELRKGAIDGLGDSINKQLQDAATKGGDVNALTSKAIAEMRRLQLPIARFPEQMAQVGRQLAVAAAASADKALQDLMRSANLTKAEAQRRMAADMAGAMEKNRRDLVTDELVGMVGRQEQFAAKGNPRMPRMNTEQRKAAAEQYQQYLEGLGIGGDQQVGIAKLFNSKQGGRAQEMFGALMGQGFDERTALEALPGIFQRQGGRRFNIDAEANRATNRELTRQRREANGLAAFHRTPDAQRAAGFRNVGVEDAEATASVREMLGPLARPSDTAVRPGVPRVVPRALPNLRSLVPSPILTDKFTRGGANGFGADDGKAVALLGEAVKEIKQVAANTSEIARQSNVAILG